MRKSMVAIPLLLAACGSEPTSSPPAERVASLIAADTSVLVFTGKKVALREFFIARDANGSVLPTALLTCTAPAGFMVVGDTLRASASEARGKLVCSATTVRTSMASARLLGAEPTDSLMVTAGIDLSRRNWKVSYRCTAPGSEILTDSTGFDRAVVDSVVYSRDISYFSQRSGVAQVHFTGRFYRWRSSGVVDTLTSTAQGVITAQLPDTLVTRSGGVNRKAPVQVVDGLRRYTGGSFCATGVPTSAMVIEEFVP